MADQEMLERHRETWQGFVKLSTYAVTAVAVIMLLMAAFLT
ncbi:MAG: aa3-type cytochrome c oxidase subunit IV [Proteobacteria bacterium]|nr:aa3-type cytochrome c oxidase subunit IV [Pseudomonadota bacterium]MCH8999861.1 aa3-type cytochrome c oxidase subunit IV [Pseudomonadota bacterium]